VRQRAEIYYQQLDALRSLRQQARRDLLAEGGKHGATKLLWSEMLEEMAQKEWEWKSVFSIPSLDSRATA
jgi:hypothetical protein